MACIAGTYIKPAMQVSFSMHDTVHHGQTAVMIIHNRKMM
jgi:hypothetical protein